jgi:paraquat-inducible protein B
MSKSADTRLIGLFVLGALALAVVLLLIFGGGRYFTSAKKYVAYFQGSVNGLNVGAPVKLKGVSIGRVTDILVQYDMEHNRVLTPVIVQIDLRKVTDIREDHKAPHPPTLPELIDRGLRARLSLQSLVTAQLYVDVNFHPERPVQLAGTREVGLPEIPTIPSDREEIENTIHKTLSEVRELPIKETFEAMLHSLRQIEHLLAAPETRASIGNLNRTLEDLQHLIRHVDGKVDTLSRDLDETVRDSRTLVKNLNGRMLPLLETMERTLGAVTDTFTHAQGTLSAVEDFGQPDSELSTALRDFSKAARSVRILADYLERNPQALIYGRQREGDER